MKILIIRFSSFGDIISTSPIIRCLKEQIPDVRIHYLLKKEYQSVISANKYIDEIHYFQNYKQSLINLKKIKFDYIVDLHNNLRSKIIAFQLSGNHLTFNKLNFQKWLIVNFKIDILPNIHIVDRYFNAIKKLNVKNDLKGLDLFIHPENEYEIREKAYTAICISAKHSTKKLPKDQMIKLIEKLNGPIVLLGGPEDEELGDQLQKRFDSVNNLSGKINMQQTASIIKKAEKVICFDTAMMHIAAAFNKDMISIWGNTIPKFGMYPYLIQNNKLLSPEKQNIIQNSKIKCRPCSKIGYEKCPKGHFQCMESLNFEEIS